MSRYRLGILCSICAAALLWVAALPMRAISWALEFIPLLTNPRPFEDLFGRPALALVGPADCSIATAVAHEQRHEAGLARLGTVRHR